MGVLVRCMGCQGRKTEFGLGMIERKCSECEGIGSASYDDKVIVKVADDEIDTVDIDDHENENQNETVNNAPKRGRPKKAV